MSNRPIALVTGASSGIGHAYASQLARDHDLVLVARRKERLDALATELEAAHGAKSEVLVCDLASDAGIATAVARVSRGDLALLVNNAGVSRYAPFAGLDPNAIDEMVRLHVLGVTRMVRAALPAMIERKSGAIVNIASLLSLSGTLPPNPFPQRAVYAACKAYLLAFTQTLSHEVAASGVKVQVVLPGIVETEFHDSLPSKAHMPPGMKATDVVAASLSALASGEVVCIPPLADAAAFDKLGEAQRAVLSSARMTELAARYR